MTIDGPSPNSDAPKPARALPSSGPDDHEIISSPARRPRRRSGIVSFHSAPRKMPLMASAAPANASATSASHNESANPNRAMNAPQPAAANTIARPLWCTRTLHPLVSMATIAPTAGAAHSSPTTSAPPYCSATAGKSANGMAKNIALMSIA